MMRNKLAALPIALSLFVATSCAQKHGGNRHVVKETYVHKYGVEVTSNDWKERGKNGKVVTTLDSGVVVTQNYAGGILEGEATYTFPHSDQIAVKEAYVGGKRSCAVAYNMSGAPATETRFHEKNNEKQVVSWYENGAPQCEERFVGGKLIEAEYYSANHDLEAKVENGYGTRLVRGEFGQVAARDTIEAGLFKSRTTFHTNGAPKEIMAYKNDEIHGTVKRFLVGGEPDTIEKWAKGKQHGVTTVFQNGEVSAEVSYLNGIKSGIEKRFRDNGNTVVEEVTWENGQRHGPTNIYLDGQKRTEWFFKGVNVSKALFDLKTKRQRS